MDCSTLDFPVLHYLPEFTQTQISVESVIPSNHFILCWLLLLLPSIFPSIRVFSNELALCIKWPKYSSFNFSTNPSIEYSGLMGELSKWKKQLQTEANTMRTLTDGLKMRYFHIILFLYLSSHGDMLCFFINKEMETVTSLDEGCRFRRSQDLDSWLLQNLCSSPSFPPKQWLCYIHMNICHVLWWNLASEKPAS